MKRCPQCRRDYYDDSLLYCLDDGTALLEGPGSGGSRTQILGEPLASESENETTRLLQEETGPETRQTARSARLEHPVAHIFT